MKLLKELNDEIKKRLANKDLCSAENLLRQSLSLNYKQLSMQVALGKILLDSGRLWNDPDVNRFGLIPALTVARVISPPPKFDAEYVKHRFKSLSSSYEMAVAEIQYSAPDIVVNYLVNSTSINHASTILDVGCGTGLVGSRLSSLTSNLYGLDISPEMLVVAASKGIYKSLMEASFEEYFEEWLKKNLDSYDFIVAASVAPWVGSLESWIRSGITMLAKNGAFIFTFDISDNISTFEISNNFHYKHSISYIKGLVQSCSGNVIILPIIERLEAGSPVSSALAVVSRAT